MKFELGSKSPLTYSRAGEVAVSVGQQATRPTWKPGVQLKLGEWDDAVTQVADAKVNTYVYND